MPGIDNVHISTHCHNDLGLAIAYMGDDLNDLPCLKTVGYAFCPQDASAEIRAAADYVTRHNAGYGAVREVCDLLLARTQIGRRYCDQADEQARG